MSPLHKRILTALVLLTVLILIVKQGEPWITGLFAILGLGMLGEWVYNLLKAQKSIATKLYLLTLGTPYILFGTFGFYQVYQLNPLLFLREN
jgi:CDP-diglyceride synthetase